MFGGGAKPAATPATGGMFGGGAKPAATPAPAAGGGMFGGAASKTAAPATGGSGFSFGGAAAKPATTPAPAGGGGFSLGGTGTTAAKPVGSALGGGLLGAKAPATGTALTLGGGGMGKTTAPAGGGFALGGATATPGAALAGQHGNNALIGASKSTHRRPPRVTMQQLAAFFHRRPGTAANFPHFFDYLSPQLQNVQTNQQIEQIKMSARLFSHRAQHIFRLIEHLRSTAVGMQSPMQHMFYRYRRSNERFTRSHLCTLPQKFQAWDNANTTESHMSARLLWPFLSEALWEEAERKENIAGIEVMPDPIQGLEQLRDYIKIRTGMSKEVEKRGPVGGLAVMHQGGAMGAQQAGLGGVPQQNAAAANANANANQINLRINVRTLLDTVSQCSARFGDFRDQAALNRNRIDNVKRRHYELRHRLVRIMGMVEKLRKKTLPVSEDDVVFRQHLNHLANQLNDPSSSKALLTELKYQLKVTQNVTQKKSILLSDMNVARAHEFLKHQYESLAALKEVLQRDTRDVKIILEQRGQNKDQHQNRRGNRSFYEGGMNSAMRGQRLGALGGRAW